MILTKDFAEGVYDILVKEAGAPISLKENFMYHMTNDNCSEYRFQGKLLFGGKYWSDTNRVNYYREDKNEERDMIVERTNEKLKYLQLSMELVSALQKVKNSPTQEQINNFIHSGKFFNVSH